MNDMRRPAEQLDRYFDDLARDPLVPAPPGLDAGTADIARTLVAEQRAREAADGVAEACERVWQSVVATTEHTPRAMKQRLALRSLLTHGLGLATATGLVLLILTGAFLPARSASPAQRTPALAPESAPPSRPAVTGRAQPPLDDDLSMLIPRPPRRSSPPPAAPTHSSLITIVQ